MKSIRGRLTISMLAACLLLLSGVGFLVEYSLRRRLTQEFDERLRMQALAITTVTKQEREYVDIAFTDPDRYIHEFGAKNPVKFFEFWSPLPFRDEHGRKIERSDSLKGADLPRKVGTLDQPAFWNFQLPDGRPGRAIGIRYVPHADEWDRRRNFNARLNLELVVAEDRTALDAAVADMRRNILLVGLLGLGAVVVVVPGVLRHGLRPLDELSRQAGRITAHNLAYRFPATDLPRELVPICNDLNSLLERLERSFVRERRLSSDLAHELRTPIAELRSLAESHIAFPENDQQELATDAYDISLQMQSMVTKLLWIYRSEQGRLPVVPEPVDICELVNDLWEPHREQTERKGITFSSDIPSGSTLITDRTLITSIVSNLLGNAAEYTPLKGAIHVQYRRTGNRFQFAVRNSADIADPVECERMFDRFWRGDKARSSGQHVGLGLSIVSAFADLLKYKVEASLSQFSSLMVTVEGNTELDHVAPIGGGEFPSAPAADKGTGSNE
jgi:signal transduction histidine kinase